MMQKLRMRLSSIAVSVALDELEECRFRALERLRAMAQLVILRRGELGERLPRLGDEEERVVPEGAAPARRLDDPALDVALEGAEERSRTRERDDAPEAR